MKDLIFNLVILLTIFILISCFYFCINKKSIKIIRLKDKNSKKSIQIADNKLLTKKILLENNISTPKGIVFDKEKDNFDFNINMNFPLVIKPINEMKSRGVVTDIENKQELINELQKSKYKKLIIEEQVEGDLFRILVADGIVVDIIVKKNAFIIGDGVKTIKEHENLNKKVKIDKRFLKKQGFSKDMIVPLNKKVFLTRIPLVIRGAKSQVVDISKVHKDNLDMFKKASLKTGLRFTGIDFICKNISESYKKNNGMIIELNANPFMKPHRKQVRNRIKKILN